MLKKPLAIAAIAATVTTAAISTPAAAGEPVLGALLGAGIGAAIGHSVNGHDGAAVGGALGAIAGAAIAANSHDYYDGYYGAPAPYYGAPAYAAPVPAYGVSSVYYAPPVRYYGHRHVVVRPHYSAYRGGYDRHYQR